MFESVEADTQPFHGDRVQRSDETGQLDGLESEPLDCRWSDDEGFYLVQGLERWRDVRAVKLLHHEDRRSEVAVLKPIEAKRRGEAPMKKNFQT